MKIYNCDKMIANVEVDFSSVIVGEAVENDNSMMVPYTSKKLLSDVKALIDDVVEESGVLWKMPDYEKSRVYFYISEDDVSLAIEVFPYAYTATEKQAMLVAASKEEGEDGWSEELGLMNMFDEIDQHLHCSEPIGEVGVYQLSLTPEEKSTIFSIINKGD